jgi:2-polyprenyl-6-methoxyphenol hydroxylase-like FAD-dependent oxidoreductase
MSPKIWSAQQAHARSSLPPQFSELVQETKEPFVQVITDVLTPKSSFMDGKVLLVGDALAGFRPHTAASTSQAALHALLLKEVMAGRMELGEWERRTKEWARWMSGRGIQMGNHSQFGKHPLVDDW